ncbi:MAG: helix-turn-helix domain-containing protein [Oscillospiraceae bacterium]|nr:helix-turn-helix domain-containing protein [Oscillospiraceae bacterium]
MNEQNSILTIRQAAQTFGFPEFGLRTLIKRGAFPVIKCGNRCYITKAVLEDYIQKGGETYETGNIKIS